MHNSDHKNGYYKFWHFLFCRWVGLNLWFPALPTIHPPSCNRVYLTAPFPFKLQENKVWLEQQRVVVVAKFKFFQLLSRNMREKNGPLVKMILGRNGKMFGRENVVASLDLKPLLMQFNIWTLINGKRKGKKFENFSTEYIYGYSQTILVIFTRKNSYANWEKADKGRKYRNLLQEYQKPEVWPIFLNSIFQIFVS